MRIVSLLPSVTEILFAIGAGDRVVGVTFECDHPPEARSRRIVSGTALPEGLTPAGIDAEVSAMVAAGQDLYRLDAGALSELDADLVVTQDLCAVCAIDAADVEEAMDHLGCDGRVMTVAPTDLAGVMASIAALGEATGTGERARELVAGLEGRLDAVRRRVGGARRVRTLLLEWTDPPFAPGHWIPEMVEIAGGTCLVGRAGGRSRRIGWDDVAAADPEVVVCAPCGFGLEASAEAAAEVVARGVLPDGVPVWAVDANASYARPGPRLVDGVETLAALLHPGPADGPPRDAVRACGGPPPPRPRS